MGPFLRVLFTCAALCLLLLSVVRGSQSDPEVDSKSFIPLSQETESFLSENIEDVHIHEPIQYKTAEIADAMQSTDIQTDPVVLLSMVPGQIRDKAEVDATVSVCNGAKDGVDCGASEKDPADTNERTKSQTNGSLPEELKTEESNTTDNGKALKVNCEERNITGIENFTLQILNVSQDLMEFLNPNSSECTLALFYIPWCRFSASLAPHFNSLPRAFPTLHFVALDASQHSSLSTRFGTVAVPNILLFQGAKPMARFNHTERTFDALKAFIYNQSGIEAKADIVISEADCEGPLPCEPIEGIDWLLVFSCLYVTIFILYATVQTESIRWLIPGQEHEHQE